MSMTMTQENKQQSFFTKYKKWIIAFVGLQLVPVVILLVIFGGGAIYIFSNNDTNFHPYKSYIMKGFRAGFSEGVKDYSRDGRYEARVKLHSTPWSVYEDETSKIKKEVTIERSEYLQQFPESERGIKLAEMKQQGIKLPLQQQLDKRFTRGVDFYADYVKQRVNRNNYDSDEEYNKALKDMAWKVGFEYGYYAGLADYTERSALRSIQ